VNRSSRISVELIMEQCWHNQIIFGSGINGGALWELKANGSGEKVVLSNIPKFEGSVSFAKDDMSDLQSLPENHYCVPDHTNFPTVDSFVALINPFCDLKNNKLCLVGFQMTTGEKKHLKLVGGRRIRAKFQELCKETLDTSNMYIVFVTTEKNAPSLLKKKRVKWIIESGEESEEFRDVRQFVLVMPDSLGIVPVENMSD